MQGPDEARSGEPMKTKKLPVASSQPERLVRKSAADILAYTKTAKFKEDSRRIRAIRSDEIDFSDIPELTEEELKSLRPATVQRTIRLDADVLRWLKSKPGPYQTRINAMLRALMLREATM
jgi:uncharacterized protein (DUF4415 family)